MATKPVTTITWADNFNYTTGPFIGSPTKLSDAVGPTEGSIPGEGVVAEFYNYNINILGQWSRWIFAGSTLPALDAHVIETDSDGLSKIAAMEVGGTASNSIALVVTESSGFGFASSTAISATNNALGNAIVATVAGDVAAVSGVSFSDTGPAIEALNSGDGVGLLAICNTGISVDATTVTGTAGRFISTSTGFAIDASNDDNTSIQTTTDTGVALNAIVTDDGTGGVFSANADPGARGIVVNCNTGIGIQTNTTSGTALDINLTTGTGIDMDLTTGTGISVTTTTGGGISVVSTSGIPFSSSNTGLFGHTSLISNVNGISIQGAVQNTGGPNSIGVLGWNLGSGRGVYGLSEDGVGVEAETTGSNYALTVKGRLTGPVYGAMKIYVMGDEPGFFEDGGIWTRRNPTGGNVFLKMGYDGATFANNFWYSRNGHAFGQRAILPGNAGYSTTVTDATYANWPILTCSFDSGSLPFDLAPSASVRIKFGFTVTQTGAAVPNNMKFRIFDVTANAVVQEYGVTQVFPTGTAGTGNTISLMIPYALPAAGARQFRLDLANTTDNGDTLTIQAPWIELQGVFNAVNNT